MGLHLFRRLMRNPRHCLTGLIVAAAASPSGSLGAQQPILIRPSSTTCSGCTIVLRQGAVLGKETDETSISPIFTSILRNSRNEYIAYPTYEPGEIAVYGSGGELRRTFGKHGSGPGEIADGPGRLVMKNGDTIQLFDTDNRRRSVFGPDFRFVRSAPFPVFAQSLVVLPNDEVIAQAELRDPENVGFPLHRIDASGHVMRSFGAAATRYRIGDPMLRALAPASQSRIWSAHVKQYRIELWDTSGDLRLSLERRVPWFEPWTAHGYHEPFESPPKPRIARIMLDSRQRMWVLLHVADRRWKASAPPSEHPTLASVSAKRMLGFIDSVIEVIDLNSNSIIASRRDDDPVIDFIGEGEVYKLIENAAGIPQIVVWHISVDNPSSSRR